MNPQDFRLGGLYEIYRKAAEPDSFSVGKIVAVDDTDVLFVGIDPEGRLDAFDLFALASIAHVAMATDYLDKIELLARRQRACRAFDPYQRVMPSTLNHHQLRRSLINWAQREHQLVTIGVSTDDRMRDGVISTVDDQNIQLRLMQDDLQLGETETIAIHTIDIFEFCSVTAAAVGFK